MLSKCFRKWQNSVAVLAALLLSACATNYKPISAPTAIWQTGGKSVVVLQAKVPEADHAMIGSQGLLDMAINLAASSSLREKLKTYDPSRLEKISQNISQKLSARGFKTTVLDQKLDVDQLVKFSDGSPSEAYAPFDFRAYKAKGANYVLFVNPIRVGTQRNYYGFIPLNPPIASVQLVGMLVDVNDNKLVWYGSRLLTSDVPNPWDMSPDFPNLMATVKRNAERAAEQLEEDLFSGAPSSVPVPTTPPAVP